MLKERAGINPGQVKSESYFLHVFIILKSESSIKCIYFAYIMAAAGVDYSNETKICSANLCCK